ncbi:MAG: sigma-70 family RNA polymerase sigma factor [Tepidisphaera sp.]|nr:sigma-70 family RNA polymerase sigma factor [Tepidisphaera sp.]
MPPGQALAADLTRRVAHGDAVAFEMLYRLWFPRVLTLTMAATGRDESFCLDVTQETMLRAAKSIPVLNSDAALGAWFARVSLRIAIDLMKSDTRRRRRERQTLATSASAHITPEPVAESLDHAAWLRAVLPTLPLHDYELLIQRLAADRTLAQAGRSLSTSPHAAHGRLRRLLARLRDLANGVVP